MWAEHLGRHSGKAHIQSHSSTLAARHENPSISLRIVSRFGHSGRVGGVATLGAHSARGLGHCSCAPGPRPALGSPGGKRWSVPHNKCVQPCDYYSAAVKDLHLNAHSRGIKGDWREDLFSLSSLPSAACCVPWVHLCVAYSHACACARRREWWTVAVVAHVWPSLPLGLPCIMSLMSPCACG